LRICLEEFQKRWKKNGSPSEKANSSILTAFWGRALLIQTGKVLSADFFEFRSSLSRMVIHSFSIQNSIVIGPFLETSAGDQLRPDELLAKENR